MFGDFDLNSLMQQAQKMQDDLERAQAELADKEYTASAGGDLVSVKLSGKGDLLSVDIKPEAWDPEDPETLSAQFVAAFRAGLDRIAALPCEILITTHTQSAGSLLDRLDGKAPLLEPGACKAYARGGHDGLDARLAKEASGDAP